MTSFNEMYTSLLRLYKAMMFPKNGGQKWSMNEVDEMDARFFNEVMNFEESESKENDVYLSDIW